MTYYLVFSSHWDRDKGLDWGRLSLNCLGRGNINIWTATTGTGSNQNYLSQFERGGVLPANNNTKGKKYHILTTPEDSRGVKGVEGSFYRIYPNDIITTKGTIRTACGIHKDANLPGSLGCIVLPVDKFPDFEQAMKELKDKGVKQLPLQVQYS
jgi:hypothetical protein